MCSGPLDPETGPGSDRTTLPPAGWGATAPTVPAGPGPPPGARRTPSGPESAPWRGWPASAPRSSGRRRPGLSWRGCGEEMPGTPAGEPRPLQYLSPHNGDAAVGLYPKEGAATGELSKLYHNVAMDGEILTGTQRELKHGDLLVCKHRHNIGNARLTGLPARLPVGRGALSFPNVPRPENAEGNGIFLYAASLNAPRPGAWAFTGVPAGRCCCIRGVEGPP